MANILTDLTENRQKESPEQVAYHFQNKDGMWQPCSWQQFADDVDSASYALETLGLRPADMLAIFSANCPEILVTDFAAYHNRAVPVSLYATSSPEQVEYILNDAGARFAFAGDRTQYEILLDVAPRCPKLEKIIVYDPAVSLARTDSRCMSFASLISLGRAASAMCRDEVRKRKSEAMPADLATLIYTSGTTGEPKGAMLPHSCFNVCLETHRQFLTMLSESDTSIAFLPLSHIFEKAWSYFCLYRGIEIYINRNPKQIQETLRQVRPTTMCSVPRFWEKAYAAIQEKLSKATGFRKKLVLKALRVGAERNLRYKRLGKNVPFLLEIQYRFFDRKIFSAVRKAMGVENGNIFPIAGAPLSANIVDFFKSIGVNIVIGYGLSETTATVSCYPDTDYEIGTVGTPISNVQVRIGDQNEIQIKGPTVMSGYYNRPDDTEKAFTDDGWFRTGDAGYINSDGAIVLTERIKDLFKTSNGKYIAPQAIESRLGEDRYIE
ncbi:MAG: long-chain fatty acid--CoA ligase, partial [Muribaculaceae bacterium]|nr:long-chain fatty acid--CoA ligase [Muribaculaceae bacterium]